jgi:hypothetical protein
LTLTAKRVNTREIAAQWRRRENSMRGLPRAFFAFDVPGHGAGNDRARLTKTTANTKTTAKTV